jgi:hypothetical protein
MNPVRLWVMCRDCRGELNKRQLAELKKALASMELPPKKRQRLLWRMAKYGVIAAAKRNVRNQETPDGEPGRA